jgi:hypothetical protein
LLWKSFSVAVLRPFTNRLPVLSLARVSFLDDFVATRRGGMDNTRGGLTERLPPDTGGLSAADFSRCAAGLISGDLRDSYRVNLLSTQIVASGLGIIRARARSLLGRHGSR